ncbi:GYD domain-containing protein [Haloarcula nitratireducens]|uniref:GYD domain-containing protein n=1 Tax=Haloarcula nitratireducens TaxID=2487749 RepID=A0AAW4P987_9EURY|nr:GYD domain-containing protein [Halomicroarcula nitratireducens]MBX0294479.1 GYD domain-containing protein [Halomicroarcula nitratireducens]
MPTYSVLADVNEQEIQNAQELVSIWGDVQQDIEDLGGELLDSYALAGSYDFLLTFEVPDEDTVLQASIAIERYGLDTETMRAVPTERFGELVMDI